ncbi:MAG: hypothetical protein E5X94_01715 [Mesorhizobium sp.]|uniref:hypothetical protein n=2 Tax=Mesorhizobium TaxID=68287 RepID=UPI0012136F4B|nr:MULTISPECIES: hypothetical protein [unclassified Mesorhizobium]MDG4903156.1 hypothetical protein [Mesorhizobium sp. WSM4962]TIN82667.1 MAG: hypothetical protein E5X97_29340 [Mesorhizobium sp.]TIN87061.1 MAG: hypothetical protein E5X94_01715 [Mesorhizobium sp.]TIV48183.1 MAG: hypothetical protein E5V86_32490 [Mesorhizobium sp.]TIV94268.1 MAG: hypothetical protein E5V74_23750 [Mesorhizobium sp.]
MVAAGARAKPFRPPDAAEIERFLDYMAGLMERNPRERHLALPIWRALERELKVARDAEAIYDAARRRLRQSQDRTAALSS